MSEALADCLRCLNACCCPNISSSDSPRDSSSSSTEQNLSVLEDGSEQGRADTQTQNAMASEGNPETQSQDGSSDLTWSFGSGSEQGAIVPNWINEPDPLFEDDPFLSDLKYNKFQDIGAQRQRWIEDADAPDCPITNTTLTFADLVRDWEFPEPTPENLDIALKDQVMALGLPNEFATIVENSVYREFSAISIPDFVWNGIAGPGVISIDEIYRESQSTCPRIAYMTKAIYEYNFPLEGLRYIFLTSIVNKNTERFMRTRLYVEGNELAWPAASAKASEHLPLTWESGTPEYEGLLGTKLGKVVAYFVLSAYPRGTRRIARIVSWPLPVCLRFDIEDI